LTAAGPAGVTDPDAGARDGSSARRAMRP
jgi:hypothetical protein